MSANLTAYKTIFVKPDASNRMLKVNDKVAYAMVFKPLETTVEEVQILARQTLNSVTYKMGIVSVANEENQTSRMPAMASLDALKDSLSYSEVTLEGSNTPQPVWIRFVTEVSLPDASRLYALVIYSDVTSTSSTNDCGIYYTETPPSTWTKTYIKESYVFNGFTSEWSRKTDCGGDIAANVYMYGSSVDENNALDLGSVTTSGTNSFRNYEMYLTLKNEGTTSARNVITYPVAYQENSTETYAEETFLAPSKWLRYDSNYLPTTCTNFETKLCDATYQPIDEARVGDFVLFVQKEFVYAYPKIYFYVQEAKYDESSSALTPSSNLSVADPNAVVFHNETEAEVVVDQPVNEFKTFSIYNKKLYKDSKKQNFATGSLSPLTGKYISHYSEDSVQNAYRVLEHTRPNHIKVEAQRIYPISDLETVYFDPSSINQSIISKSELSSVYSEGWEIIPFTPCSRGRFIDTHSANTTEWCMAAGRLFPLSLVAEAETNATGDSGNSGYAGGAVMNRGNTLSKWTPVNNSVIPYFVVNNFNNAITGWGSNIQTIGHCLFSGRSTANFYSLMVPEVSDREALTRLGIMDKDKYFDKEITSVLDDGLSSAQGLALVTHDVFSVGDREVIEAYLIRRIDNSGIVLDGRILMCAYFTTVTEDENDSTYSLIYFPKLRFTQAMNTQLTAVDTWFVPDPFNNKYLAAGVPESRFKIVSANEHYLKVYGTVLEIQDAANKLGFSSASVPCYLTFRGTTTDTYGFAYGQNKYDDPDPAGDFFLSYNATADLDSYEQFSGTSSTEYDADPRYWYGSTTNVGTVASTYEGDIALCFEMSENTYSPSSANFFYNTHNLKQIEQFVDDVPLDTNIAIYMNSTETVAPSSDKEQVKTALRSAWEDAKKGTITFSNDYNAMLTAATASLAGTNKNVFFFACDKAAASVSSTLSNALSSSGIIAHCIRVSPAKNDGYLKQISSQHSGLYTTYTNNRNLSEIMMRMLGNLSDSNSKFFPNPDVKTYSIVIPLTLDTHSASIDAYMGRNSTFATAINYSENYNSLTASQNLIDDDKEHGYDVYLTPVHDWAYDNKSYSILEPYSCPENPQNSNNYSDFTVYKFSDSSIDISGNTIEGNSARTFSNKNNLVLDLSTGSFSANDRISFAYRLGLDEQNISATTISSIRCLIQGSTSINFDMEGNKTFTIFDGLIDTDPTTAASNVLSTFVEKVGGYTLPDGYNLLLLDLRNAISLSTCPFLRIYMTPTKPSENVSNITRTVSVKNLHVYKSTSQLADFPNNFVIGALYSPVAAPKEIFGNSPNAFAQDKYYVIDLGKERHVKEICFDGTTATNAAGDTIILSHKSFVDVSDGEKIVMEIDPVAEFGTNTTYSAKQITSLYTRLLILKMTGIGTSNIHGFTIKCGYTSGFYAAAAKASMAINSEFAFYNENIESAPTSRVAMMKGTKNTVGILIDSTTARSVTQVSFSAKTNKSTIFKLQKRSDAIPTDPVTNALACPVSTGWTTIKSFKVSDHDRIDGLVVQRIDTDGLVICAKMNNTGTAVNIGSKFMNNGLVGCMLTPETKQELSLLIVQSWIDGTDNFIKVNANVHEIGVDIGTRFNIERQTVVTFDATPATALQLVQVTGGETKINSLRAYTNLIGSDGLPVPPTTGATGLNWFFQIDTI